MFQAIGPELIDCSQVDPEQFRIEVEWEDDKPKTREKDADNFNLIFIDEGGKFVVNQISLVTRPAANDRRFGFWVCIQELYVGQIVLIVEAKAKQLGEKRVVRPEFPADMLGPATVAPLHAEYAHRMANPFTMFPECRKLVEEALRDKRYSNLSGYTEPEWQPVYVAMPKQPKDTELAYP
ncbi:MAG: hypothetical protein ACREFK_01080, partial [Stellaceae bacterium]